ncbi:MAG: copper amine oxidase N-terminal domain-containing protein [Anaerotignum sp.]|nr:copper amine oxidase N-terminal domain-containing protein [Anaerotignum sp.]
MKKWKKLLAGLMTAVMLAAMPVSASAANDITVYVDGQKVVFDQPPVVQNGRTLVPMRAIFEALGAEIEWFGAEKRVNAFWGMNSLDLWIGSCEIQMGDGSLVTIDVPAQVVNGRTLVPLRAVSQCMGAEVKWDGITKTININREPEGFYYQNDLYGFTFDTPEGFRFMEEYTDGSGAWYEHKTDPVYVSVLSEYIPSPEGSSIAALQKYFHDEDEDVTYSMIRDDYSMELMMDYGDSLDFYYVHLHNNVGTAVAVNMPWDLYEQYMDHLEEIHSCLAFG